MFSQSYRYYPLFQLKDIRLVQLLPGSEEEPVEIRLHAFALHLSPSYEALSYVWGGLLEKHLVRCEGRFISATSNLYQCLRELRRDRNRPWLWIDAICINQDDQKEREQFAQNIPAIYTNAIRTICWVPTSFPRLVSDFIRKLHQAGPEATWQSDFISEPDLTHSDRNITASVLDAFRANTASLDSQVWQSLDMFLDNPYFSRLWLLHDIICSRNPVLRCQSEEIAWAQLSYFLEPCAFCSSPTVLKSSGVMTVIEAQHLRRRYHMLQPAAPTRADLLVGLHACKLGAMNPRDYVYAPYSIAGGIQTEQKGPMVDYTLGFDQVFIRASMDLNIYSRDFLSLSLIDDAAPRLPSWTPDWSVPHTRFLLNHPKSSFCASNQPVPNASYNDYHGHWILKCKGLLVDTIRATASYLPPRRHCDHYNVGGSNSYFFGEWFEFAKTNARTAKEDVILLEYAGTIQARGCNHLWESSPPLDAHKLLKPTQDFLDFLENEDAEETDDIRLFYAACFAAHDRRFGITQRGHFCLVPRTATRGDLVCIPHGNRVPLVFRRVEGRYRNIGECYVQGMMHGEAVTFDGVEETFEVI